jgi:type III secretory pathway component EscV
MLEVIIMLADDPTPKENDVVAGPLGFALWIFMILAVVVLGFSLVKQLRKAQAAKDAGLYGDEPVDPSQVDETAERTDTER